MNRYGLCATLPAPGGPQPALALMGGNGGIDSVNSVVLFSTTPRHAEERDPFPRRKDIFLNRIGCDEDEEGRVFASTTVNFNPDGPSRPPMCSSSSVTTAIACETNLCDASGPSLSPMPVGLRPHEVVMRRMVPALGMRPGLRPEPSSRKAMIYICLCGRACYGLRCAPPATPTGRVEKE